jgi:hypothetical protein
MRSVRHGGELSRWNNMGSRKCGRKENGIIGTQETVSYFFFFVCLCDSVYYSVYWLCFPLALMYDYLSIYYFIYL